MVRGLMGGIGQALVAAGSQYGISKRDEEDRLRRRAIEDKATGRQDVLWDRQMAELQAEDERGAQDVLTFGNEKVNPYDQLRRYLGQNVVPDAMPSPEAPSTPTPEGELPPPPPSRVQGLMTPLQPGQSVQPSLAQPVTPRGLVAPDGSVMSVQGATPPAPRTAPVAAKPATKPMDWAKTAFGDTVDYRARVAAQADALEPRYEAKRQQVAAAIQQILAENPNAATAKMKLAAYNRQLQKDPEFQRLQSESSKLVEEVNTGRRVEGAMATLQGALTGDTDLLKRLGYGPEARIETDPVTSLPGVRSSPGGPLIGPQILIGQALVKAGVQSFDEFAKTVNKVAESENKWQMALAKMENDLLRTQMSRPVGGAGSAKEDPEIRRASAIRDYSVLIDKMPDGPDKDAAVRARDYLANRSELTDVRRGEGEDKRREREGTEAWQQSDRIVKRFSVSEMTDRPVNLDSLRIAFGFLDQQNHAAAMSALAAVKNTMSEEQLRELDSGNDAFWADQKRIQAAAASEGIEIRDTASPATRTRSLAPRATTPQPQQAPPHASTPPLPPGFRITQ